MTVLHDGRPVAPLRSAIMSCHMINAGSQSITENGKMMIAEYGVDDRKASM